MTPIRWGTLGCARVFEKRMVPAFREAPGAELVAVASRDPQKARETAARHGIARAAESYDALLADPEIDAVYLPLPNDQHAAWTLRALAAGKHVLCDKPLALTASDAAACAAAALSAGLRLMEGFMYRHHAQHARVKALLASGAIGEPVRFSGVFTYPATPEHAGIRWNPAQGGGALTDVGVYPVDAARMLFGAEPTEVFAHAHVDPSTGVDVHTDGLLAFPGGAVATFSCGFDQAFASRYEIVGRAGSIVAERGFQVGESEVRLLVRAHNRDEPQVETFPHVNQWALEVEHFSAAVRDPRMPLAPGEDGVAQAKVVDALRRSLSTRGPVEVE